MDLFGGLAAPGWTSPQKSLLLAEEGGAQSAEVFLRGAQLALDKQSQQLQQQQQLQSMAAQGLKMQAYQKASWEDAQDAPKVADWFANTGTDIDKIMNSPMPEVTTAKAQDTILNAKKAAATTQLGQAKTKFQTDLLNETSKLIEAGFNIPINPQTGMPDQQAVADAGAKYAARVQSNRIDQLNTAAKSRVDVARIRADATLSAAQERARAAGKLGEFEQLVEKLQGFEDQLGDATDEDEKAQLSSLINHYNKRIERISSFAPTKTAASEKTYHRDADGRVTSVTTKPLTESGVEKKGVRVKSPSGQVGTIPVEQLDDALKQGYQQVK